MCYTFSEIVLLKNELKALKSLKKSNKVIDDDVRHVLLSCELAELVPLDTDDNNNLLFNNTCEISKKGERYLIYLKRIKSNKFWDWIRYIVTTLIAIYALLRTI